MGDIANNEVYLLILAAGEGRRYPGIKQLALIENVPMVRRSVLSLQDSGRYRTAVVIGAYRDEVLKVIDDLDVEIIVNDSWHEGVASSIRAGIHYIKEYHPDTTGVIVVLADQWKLRAGHLIPLLANKEKVAAAKYDEGPGVPAYFPRRYWNDLLNLSGDAGAKSFLHGLEVIILVEIPEALVDKDY